MWENVPAQQKKIWEIMVNVASLSRIEKSLSREVIYSDDSDNASVQWRMCQIAAYLV